MLSLYEILKASKTGIAPDMWTALAGKNWGGADSGHEVKELTGIPPFSFKADGSPLLDWYIKGNTVQSGTPSPTTPIQPQSCGERTGNLFDESTLLNGFYDPNTFQYYPNDNYRCFPLLLQAGTYTILAKSDILTIRLLRVSSASLGTNSLNRDNQSYTFTLPETETIYVSLRNSTTTNDFTGLTIMLNTGSTALPFEPHGVKIPILSNSTTTNVYLGEVQSTRKIGKLVLTGEGNVTYDVISGINRFTINDTFQTANYRIGICSHYKYEYVNANNTVYHTSDSMSRTIYILDNNYTTSANFKTYLAQQYAAGTPVTVWYVLATPQTATINEPLMKIGDYADSIDKAGAGVNIPTSDGINTLSVNTSVQPSEVYIKYKK